LNSIKRYGPDLVSFAKVWLPLALLLALWLSIAPGRLQNLAHPGSFIDFGHGVRGVLPFIIIGVSSVVISLSVYKHRYGFSFFVGPLGLVFLYAAVGIFATFMSPDKSQSIYWSGSYIAVPLALWAIGYGPNALARVQRIVDMTCLLMVVFVLVLFVFAFIKLDLAEAIFDPRILERCGFGPVWFTDTGETLRSTGVGRYSGVAALIGIAGVAYGRWRYFWGFFLFAALLILVSTGARTAFVSFVGASSLMVFLYWGRKSVIVAASILIISVPILLATGAHSTVLSECFRRTYLVVDSSATNPNLTQVVTDNILPGETTSSALLPGETTSSALLPGETTSSALLPGETTSSALLPGNGVYGVATQTSRPLVSFSGRIPVWKDGLSLFKDSPILGHGFNSDRLMLRTQMHNSLIHSMVQTGLLGSIPFVAGILLAWVLVFKSAFNLRSYSDPHRTRIVLAGGMLAFFSIRSVAESTAAFFGVDLLLLTPVLLYLWVVNQSNDGKA